MNGPRRSGFTLTEVLVVLVLGSLVALALNTAQLNYRRIATWSGAVIRDHDAFRVAVSLLSADLREAVYSEGDVVLHADDSLSVRAPMGFSLVCSVRDNPAAIGIQRSEGLTWSAPGDSLLLYTTSGWTAVEPDGTVSGNLRQLACADGSLPDQAYRLPRGSTDAVPVGAPVRVFRRHTYHTGLNQNRPWLARTDRNGTEFLVGPLLAGTLRFRLVDAAGGATARVSDATGVEAEFALPLTPVPGQHSATADTFTFVLQGRNR